MRYDNNVDADEVTLVDNSDAETITSNCSMNSATGSDSSEDEDIDDSRTDSGSTYTSDLDWLSQQGLKMATVPNVYLPTFARPVACMLRAILGEDKAGYPDSLLLWQALAGHGGARMAAEVKAFWSFPDAAMMQLLSGWIADPETGEVRLPAEGFGFVLELHDILLQVSHHYFLFKISPKTNQF